MQGAQKVPLSSCILDRNKIPGFKSLLGEGGAGAIVVDACGINSPYSMNFCKDPMDDVL